MARRQRQDLALQLLQTGQRRRIGAFDKHPAGAAKTVAEVEQRPAFLIRRQGGVHLRPARFQPLQGLRGGMHFFDDKLQTGHARNAMQQVDVQAHPVTVLVLEYVGRHLLGHYHDMGMLQ